MSKQLSVDPQQLTMAVLVRPFGRLPDDALVSLPVAAVLANVCVKTLARHIAREKLRPANDNSDVTKSEFLRWYRANRSTLHPGRPRKPVQALSAPEKGKA